LTKPGEVNRLICTELNPGLIKVNLRQGCGTRGKSTSRSTSYSVDVDWKPTWVPGRSGIPHGNGILLLETTAFFKFDLGKWTSFDIVQDRLVRPIFSTQGAASTKPLLLHRATVIQTDKILMLTGHGHIRNKRCASCGSFKEYLKSQKADLWCFSNVNLQDDGFILSQAIRNQDATAISNSSYK